MPSEALSTIHTIHPHSPPPVVQVQDKLQSPCFTKPAVDDESVVLGPVEQVASLFTALHRSQAEERERANEKAQLERIHLREQQELERIQRHENDRLDRTHAREQQILQEFAKQLTTPHAHPTDGRRNVKK